MKRIGIAASKIAKGNIWLYNFYVLLLSSLFSLLIFLLSAFAVLIGFAVVSFATKGFIVLEFGVGSSVLTVAAVALTVIVGGINLVAILMNIKIK